MSYEWEGRTLVMLTDPPHPGIEPRSPTLQADDLPTELCASHSSRKKMGRD